MQRNRLYKISLSYKFKIIIGLIIVLCFSTITYSKDRSFNILITNDDGISTKEIEFLAKSLNEVAQVYVVAPDKNKSGTSNRSSTNWSELENEPVYKDGKFFGYGVIDGFPADTVRIAVRKLYKNKKFDLVVSGINQVLNYGKRRYNSGTVGAAMEAIGHGIPAIAISQSRRGGLKTTKFAASFAKEVVKQIKNNGLPKGVLLNINVPKGVIRGIVFAPRKTSFQSEITALSKGYVTISPLTRELDDDHNSLDHFKMWNLDFKKY